VQPWPCSPFRLLLCYGFNAGSALGAAASGMVAGLVAITPSGGSLTPLAALVMGLSAGVICALAVGLKYRWRYDDSLDVVGVHLVGGLVGTLEVGVLAYAFLASGAIAWVVHRLMGFRLDEEHEVTGSDLAIHAEAAYDLHATTGARTSGAFHAPKATSGPFAPPGPQD
jgi:Amt family ammonium transporter